MSKLVFLDSLKKIDYKKLGFMCGIEIHQQLNTHKLFCSCPCEIVANDTLTKEVKRKLRFSMSENGAIDKAAINEFKKGKYNIYKYNNKISCLVDLDEEPPKGPNRIALSVALRISKMMNLKLFDKVTFMRKLIIDGSITSGYQRTAMLGFNGSIDTTFGEIKINGINLEEDSCRTLERFDNHTVFALDRQGIPLIEITTGPDVKTAQQGYELAIIIGNYLRSFSETKRGLGTIRQDLNISIKGGVRVEIKGTQNLKLIPQIIDAEIRRQKIHLSIVDELKNRKINENNFSDKNIYDITNIFKDTESAIVKENLSLKNSAVLAIKLNKFKNILGHELNKNYRFATEISNKNKAHFPTIKGLFHSDELPKYGITQEEVEKVRERLELGERDGFILVVNEKAVATESLYYILETIAELINGPIEEVRQVDPKGDVTKPLRPMPGSARMYPETDIKEIELGEELLKKEFENIPEFYNNKIDRLKKEFNLDENKIEVILNHLGEDKFRELLKVGIKSAQVFSIIFELGKEVKKREKIEPIEFEFDLIKDILKVLKEGKIDKNSLYNLYVNLYKENKINVDNLDNYLEEKGLILEEINEVEVEKKIIDIISKNSDAPFGALMGISMKEFSGKVPGNIISKLLKKNIN